MGGLLPIAPPKNSPEIASQPVGGLDFYYTPSGILRDTTPLRHNYPQYTLYKEAIIMTSLQRIRTQRGIPLYVLARRARVSLGTLTAWEKHGCPPVRIEPVQRVAAVLGVEVEELLEPVKEAQP